MNKKDIEKAMAIMQAHIDGKLIERCRVGHSDEEWEVDTNPIFDWSTYIYRVRPDTSEYRPFKNVKECLQEMDKHPNAGFLEDNSDGSYETYISIDVITDNKIYFGEDSYRFEEALGNFFFADGAPFGIKNN